eukprot:GHUV01029643.1.p1 GENE.GHUV01029643.1~~GHUV01029643.1.p1  ORF type:complete len:169 (+),score=22.79 GHUV01029643.1:128-634(+)
MAEHVAAGDRSFVDEEYEDAVKHYTKALDVSPSADAYEHRAHAYIKLEKYIEAVQDATKAIELDGKNAKAHLRKGTACFYLEEYETALQCFQQGQHLAPGDNKCEKWIHKCKAELDGAFQSPSKRTCSQCTLYGLLHAVVCLSSISNGLCVLLHPPSTPLTAISSIVY